MPPFKIFFITAALLLAGFTPAQADFGNWFVANQRLSTTLDSADKKISYRFTCQEDMNLSAAAIYCSEAKNPPAYRVSLQDDEKGLPSGTPLSSSSYVPLAQSWSTIPLESRPLMQGKVYHLVLEHDAYRGGEHSVGLIGKFNYASFLSTDFLNHLHPNDGSSDPNSNVLFWDGRQWKETNQEPVYAVYGDGSRFQGNPYDLPGTRPICGSGDPSQKSTQILQGESLHFHCGFAATSLVLRVRKQGNPKAPLNYLILKHNFHVHQTIPIYQAVALTPSQAPANFQWVTIGFGDKGKSNFSPECWFLVLQTDSGKASKNSAGCEDCYLLSDVSNSGGLANASNLTFDGGAHLSRAVLSTDGGDPYHWIDQFECDANVGAIGPACPPATSAEPQPLPTPAPLSDEGILQP